MKTPEEIAQQIVTNWYSEQPEIQPWFYKSLISQIASAIQADREEQEKEYREEIESMCNERVLAVGQVEHDYVERLKEREKEHQDYIQRACSVADSAVIGRAAAERRVAAIMAERDALRKAIKEAALLMQSIDATQSGHSILEGMHKRQAWLRQWGPEVQPAEAGSAQNGVEA